MSPIWPSISASSSLTDAKSMPSSPPSGSGQLHQQPRRPHGGKRNPNGKKDQGPPVPSTSTPRALCQTPPQPDRRSPNPNAGPAGFAVRGSRGRGGGWRRRRRQESPAGRSGGTPRLSSRRLSRLFVWFCFRFTEDLPRWIHTSLPPLL